MSDEVGMIDTVERTSRGRKPYYDEATSDRIISIPVSIEQELESRASIMSAQARKPNKWTLSTLLVDLAYRHFDIPNPYRTK